MIQDSKKLKKNTYHKKTQAKKNANETVVWCINKLNTYSKG